MVKIEEWEIDTNQNRPPIIDNVIYYNPPNSIKFSVPGIVDYNSGLLSSHDFASEPNKPYTLSARVKALGVLGTGFPIIRLTEADINGNWLRNNVITFEKGTYDWTLKSMNITTGSNTAFVYIVSHLQNSYGTYWLDDVNVSSSTDPTCPPLSASLSIIPTTISPGESIKLTSTAIGGQYGTIGDDAFGHEILIDGNVVYNSGLGKGITHSVTLQISNISAGNHHVTTRVTDACLPIHQTATSPSVTLTVTGVTCPALSADIIIVPTTLRNGEQFKFTSIAIGGQYGTIGDDAFRHEVLIDGNIVYDSGFGKDITVTDYVTVSGLSIGTHSITSRVTDACLPVHQIAYHPSITLNITGTTCLALSGALSM